MITLHAERWTPDQVWAVYQMVEQLHDHLPENHRESIRYHRWREERLEEYCNHIAQCELEEMTLEQWCIKARKPGDPVPF